MTSQVTFYVSQIIGCKVCGVNGKRLGSVMDIMANIAQPIVSTKDTIAPAITGLETPKNGTVRYLNFEYNKVVNKTKHFSFFCNKTEDLTQTSLENSLPLEKNIPNRQIEDINERKSGCANDIPPASDYLHKALNRKAEVEKKWSESPQLYWPFTLIIILEVANILTINASWITATHWWQVPNKLLIMLVCITLATNNKRIMGCYINKLRQNIIGLGSSIF
jgi:sporulation protein YlmC with PRC-barrel domain